MLLKKYEMREFSDLFSKKLRKPISGNFSQDQAFKELKTELVEHLKKFDSTLDLKVFDELTFFFEGFSLCMKYKETTGQPMAIRFIRKANDLTEKDILDYVSVFLSQLGEVEMPRISFEKVYSKQNLAMYWTLDKIISISRHTYMQLDEETVKSLLRHEAIHHYLNVNGLPSSDTSEEFIELLLEHDGFLTDDEEAKKVVEKVKRKIARNKKKQLDSKQEDK